MKEKKITKCSQYSKRVQISSNKTYLIRARTIIKKKPNKRLKKMPMEKKGSRKRLTLGHALFLKIQDEKPLFSHDLDVRVIESGAGNH